MIRLAIPAYHIVEKRLPGKWRKMLERYSSGSQTVNHENNWKKLLVAIARIVAVYSVLCIAMITLSFHLLFHCSGLVCLSFGQIWQELFLLSFASHLSCVPLL